MLYCCPWTLMPPDLLIKSAAIWLPQAVLVKGGEESG
jgi:hypothetical protein